MSELSLADMRRIGAQRNADVAQSKPSKSSLFSNLPFMGKRQAATGADSETPASVGAALPAEVAAPAPTSPKESVPAKPGFAETDAVRPLQKNALRHVGVGGAVGAVLGLGATGDPIAVMPAAAVVGAMAGNVVAKRAQALPFDRMKAISLKRKDASELFEALQNAGTLAQIDGDAVRIFVDQSAAVRATLVAGSRLSSTKSHTIHIGLTVLKALSVHQIGTLAVHALVQARHAHEAASVTAQSAARLGRLNDALSARSRLMRLADLDALNSTERQAVVSWQNALDVQLREADRFAARCAGPKVLVEALLSQALLAALVVQDADAGLSYRHSLEMLKVGYAQQELDGALRLLAKTPRPMPAEVLAGLPMSLLDRLDALDTSCPVPTLPAAAPALANLSDKTVQILEKRLSGPLKAQKPKTAEKAGEGKPKKGKKSKGGDVKASKSKRAAPAKPSKGLLGRLFRRNRIKQSDLQTTDLSEQPLYHADTLFKHDPGSGLEAYQSLVDTYPRWGLARLRLAEAQLEAGIADCVPNLMACAELLPSALPSVLDRLQSALAMVSPLEEEPLRKAVDQLLINADAIARERSEIELDGLGAPTLDAQDLDLLKNLLADTQGLREAWVFAAPCAWMPEVPHHAILGLAPRMAPDDAQAIAVALAEHSAVSGTVAVHIETGTPHGALGDALASRPSIWRAGSR